MKLYFTYSRNMPKAEFEAIINTLESLGHTVSMRRRPSSYDSFDLNEAQKIVKENEKLIKNADVIVAEVSYFSGTTGYDISYALEEKKPIITLYNLIDFKDDPRSIKILPVTIKGNTSKYLMVREYDFSGLKRTVEIALKDAKSLADTKFILIIPPEIDRYLEWNVKEKGISKAEITRQAIENMMENDKAYVEYTKGFAGDEASNS